MKNKPLLKIIICMLSVLVDARGCLAQQYSEQGGLKLGEGINERAPVTLNAGLKFDRKAEPLDPLLLPGNLFDKEVAAALLRKTEKPTEQWYKVPSWQAGRWGNEQATGTRLVYYKNGLAEDSEPVGVYKMVSKFAVGLLKDKNGDIWDRYDTGYWTETQHDAGMTYSFIYFQSAGKGDYPDLYSKMASFVVDPNTHKIESVSRSKQWGRRINLAPGIMKEEDVQTVLTESGSPKLTSWNTSVTRRLSTFSSYENKLVDQKEVEASFREYCHSEGLGDLLVDQEKYDAEMIELFRPKAHGNSIPVKPKAVAPAAKRHSTIKAKTRR